MRGTAALLAAMAVAGCAGTTAGSGSLAADVPAGGGPASPTPTADTTGSAGPTGGPTAGTSRTRTPDPDPAPAGRSISFASARIPLPAAWTSRVDGQLLCLTLSGDDGCTLVVLDVAEIQRQGGSVSVPDPGAEFGWWYGSDVPNCAEDRYVPVTRSSAVQSGFAKLGGRTAEYGYWLVTCQDSNLDFDPRLWWLPTSKLAFLERSTVAGSAAAVDALLKGVRFTG